MRVGNREWSDPVRRSCLPCPSPVAPSVGDRRPSGGALNGRDVHCYRRILHKVAFPAPVLLNQIVEVSDQLKATRSRSAKIGAIARLLQGRTAHELRTIVAWMSGDLLQGRIGISTGRAHQYGQGVAASTRPGLTIEDVDRALIAVQEATGPGSLGVRERLLHNLLGKATEAEQAFLLRLLAGELRQGALAGVMIEGIATAAGVPGDIVRRAAMLSGELPAVALSAFTGGEAALRQIDLQLFRPVLPMLAQTADDPADALKKTSPLIFEEKLDGMRLQLHRQGEGGAVQPIVATDDTVATGDCRLRASPPRRPDHLGWRDHAIRAGRRAAGSRGGDGAFRPGV